MHIYKIDDTAIVSFKGKFYRDEAWQWDVFINRGGLYNRVLDDIATLQDDAALGALTDAAAAPIGHQEVWASGVTYLRSREARMEESKDAGGGDFYDRVYHAERPEIFFKAPAYRVSGSGQAVRIRKDSKWNVPEPELTLFICSEGTIEGYTIGNDMSSRDIEGENPLYLPQAKCYDGAAGLGPCLYVTEEPIDPASIISLKILRDGNEVFFDQIPINRMKRQLPELARYLVLETSFKYGVFLMTGTGIVPPDTFSLQSGDVIHISIQGIGTLTNNVGA